MSQIPSRSRSSDGVGNAASTRRDVLKLGVAVGLAGATLRLPAPAGAQDAASPTADLCLLTPEQTEGPYYLPLELVREDITEGKPGLPMRLQIAVADVNACAPLADAAVDIWHCDAQGFYSGVNANPGGGASSGASSEEGAGSASGTFLRGVQLTDADGIAEFLTIYPGWYTGRTVHIHMKVHVGGVANVLDPATPSGEMAEGYEGGHVSHTGQLYFEDATSDEIFSTIEAYAGRDDSQRTRNDQDNTLGDNADEPGFIIALTPLSDGDPAAGFLGQITVGVDPESVPDPAGMGGPSQGGPPPGDGPPPGGPGSTPPPA